MEGHETNQKSRWTVREIKTVAAVGEIRSAAMENVEKEGRPSLEQWINAKLKKKKKKKKKREAGGERRVLYLFSIGPPFPFCLKQTHTRTDERIIVLYWPCSFQSTKDSCALIETQKRQQ